MAKAIGIVLFGIVVFAASAAGSWFMKSQLTANGQPTGESDAAAELAEAQQSQEESRLADTVAQAAPDDGLLPVAVRPRSMSVEELLRYGMSLKEREKAVREEEDNLQRRRVQQQLALADIQGERREIDGLRVQVREHLKEAEDLIQKLNQTRQQLVDEKDQKSQELKKIQEAQIEVDSQYQDNTKRLSQWIQSMDAPKAAELLKEMANDGNMEMAVQILANFEEREAAKILSAIDDPKLVQEFVDNFRKLKRPVKQTSRR